MTSKTVSVRLSKEDIRMLEYLIVELGQTSSRVLRDALVNFYRESQSVKEWRNGK